MRNRSYEPAMLSLPLTREFFQTKISSSCGSQKMKWNRKFRAEELKVYDVHESRNKNMIFSIKYCM